MKWADASKLRKNKSHKRKRHDTCIYCMTDIEIVYNGNNEAIKRFCKCGVEVIREEENNFADEEACLG